MLLLLAAVLQAQENKTYSLAQIMVLWANPVFDTSQVITAIDNAHLVIEFSEYNLASVIEAGMKGNRRPGEVAQVVLRLLKDCRNCRNQFWAPLKENDLLADLQKGPVFATDDLRVRGAESLPLSTGYLSKLVTAGATPELIALVESGLAVPTPDGFKPARVGKASGFSPLATEGQLTLHANIDMQVAFLFLHNALFFKTLSGEEPSSIDAEYTAFGPSGDPQTINFEVKQIPAKGAKPPKKNKAPQISKQLAPDTSGRTGLQVTVNDVENGRHDYDLVLTWKR
jgi:hypothetical protein